MSFVAYHDTTFYFHCPLASVTKYNLFIFTAVYYLQYFIFHFSKWNRAEHLYVFQLGEQGSVTIQIEILSGSGLNILMQCGLTFLKLIDEVYMSCTMKKEK